MASNSKAEPSKTLAVTDAEEEDATQLKFPQEFKEAEPLLISEVALLLEHRKQEHQQISADDDTDFTPVFLKTLEYTARFSAFKNRSIIAEVRQLMTQKDFDLHKFEIASIANLTPDNADEAKALIPSLQRIEESELEDLLDEIKTQKSFQTTSLDIDEAMQS